MKDFKELINIADVYGTETKGLAEKREAEIQKHLDEGIWDDLVGGISGLAKKLGIDPATADKVANAISTQPEAKAEVEKADPGTDPTGNTSGKPNPGDDPTGNTSGKPADPNATAGVDGADQAELDAGAGQAAEPAGLDVTTPNLMKAYNTGGKKAMPSITAMQTALQKAGFDPKGVDGKYGPGTFAAVKEFQTAQGLKADGQAGPETMKALQATAAPAAPVAKPTPKPAAPAAQSAPTQPSGGAAQAGVDGADQAELDAGAGQANANANAGVAGADAAEIAAGAGQATAAPDGNPTAPPANNIAATANDKDGTPGGDPMSAANQAKDRVTTAQKKKPKTDRQTMATEQYNEASMNISMNGTDSKEVAELVGILKNAGMDEPEAMAIKSLPISIGKSPMGMDDPMGHDHDHSPMGMDDPRDSSPLHSMKSSPCGEEDEAEYNALMDEWDNSPDPEYKDDDYMLNDLAGGLNRPKKSYPATQPGDNPMAVKEALWAALNKKMTEGSKSKKSRGKKSRG
jgi:peptidoglycan hydrolase-like protein with peptidoglycan-binding domain